MHKQLFQRLFSIILKYKLVCLCVLSLVMFLRQYCDGSTMIWNCNIGTWLIKFQFMQKCQSQFKNNQAKAYKAFQSFGCKQLDHWKHGFWFCNVVRCVILGKILAPRWTGGFSIRTVSEDIDVSICSICLLIETGWCQFVLVAWQRDSVKSANGRVMWLLILKL